ncbi:hypothetical protein MIAR_11870 [Microbacterium arabinogalactanolyticum]|nr:hypothetical protein MIAR_11870 [Microbacterium arabinogalactanolyticum]
MPISGTRQTATNTPEEISHTAPDELRSAGWSVTEVGSDGEPGTRVRRLRRPELCWVMRLSIRHRTDAVDGLDAGLDSRYAASTPERRVPPPSRRPQPEASSEAAASRRGRARRGVET